MSYYYSEVTLNMSDKNMGALIRLVAECHGSLTNTQTLAWGIKSSALSRCSCIFFVRFLHRENKDTFDAVCESNKWQLVKDPKPAKVD